ncbi:phosphoribosylglycinamide formyltransferase [Ectothiorhodospiraceae bacterium 2226]|nr:phosphoribosylglycinamide formyltransferase [Ectothiorhodospiraceae bacterium 2226]
MSVGTAPLPIVVLISGGGTNLQAILDACAERRVHARVQAVIANRPAAGGLERARRAGVPAQVVDHTEYSDRAAFDRALAAAIDAHRPGLVVLAGFMRILGDEFVAHYEGRMMNIHPSLLPLYRGLDTHRRAIADGQREHGASVHFVTRELDGGPVILQARVPVLSDDTPTSLAARVLEQEHRIYPQAIDWFARGRLRLEDGRVFLDDRPLNAAAPTDPGVEPAG